MKNILLILLLLNIITLSANDNKYYVGVREDGNLLLLGMKINANITSELSLYNYKNNNSKQSDTYTKITVYKTNVIKDDFIYYYGLGIGYRKLNTKENESLSGFIYVPSFGFDYYVHHHISMGAKLEYYIDKVRDDKGFNNFLTFKYHF